MHFHTPIQALTFCSESTNSDWKSVQLQRSRTVSVDCQDRHKPQQSPQSQNEKPLANPRLGLGLLSINLLFVHHRNCNCISRESEQMSFCLGDTVLGTALIAESQDCQLPGPEHEGGSVMMAAGCQSCPRPAQLAAGPCCAVSLLKTLVAQGTSLCHGL